jgi:hypothetical protein
LNVPERQIRAATAESIIRSAITTNIRTSAQFQKKIIIINNQDNIIN